MTKIKIKRLSENKIFLICAFQREVALIRIANQRTFCQLRDVSDMHAIRAARAALLGRRKTTQFIKYNFKEVSSELNKAGEVASSC